jgi:predicted exporter
LWQAAGLENGRDRAHTLGMEAFIKIALLAILALLTFGTIPNRRTGAVIAVGTCVVAAVILHFVAP